jgi:hypothetical protein
MLKPAIGLGQNATGVRLSRLRRKPWRLDDRPTQRERML